MPLSVEKIENGTVIDHIRAGKGLKVLEILGIKQDYAGRVALVMNVPSKRIGKKDIVKIEGKFLERKDVDEIALISPQATLNIIRSGEVKEKKEVKLPESIEGVFKCPNPKCITNAERIETKFVLEKKEPPKARCFYCERIFSSDEITG